MFIFLSSGERDVYILCSFFKSVNNPLIVLSSANTFLIKSSYFVCCSGVSWTVGITSFIKSKSDVWAIGKLSVSDCCGRLRELTRGVLLFVEIPFVINAEADISGADLDSKLAKNLS